MEHRYLVQKRLRYAGYYDSNGVEYAWDSPERMRKDVSFEMPQFKYFWADEQCDEASVFWKWFPDDYEHRVFIRFFVDGEEYMEGAWIEPESCDDCGVARDSHFEEFDYHKSSDGKALPEPIVQRALNMGRGGQLQKDWGIPTLLIKKSFIDKWNKLNDDVCKMEKEFADMAEQVKKGVA